MYTTEQTKQLIGGMQHSDTGSDSYLLEKVIKDIPTDEVNLDNAMLYKVKVNNTKIEALYDTGASISVMSQYFFNELENKPKLIKCNRTVSGAGRGMLIPVGECFIQLQIGSKIFRDRVIVIETLTRNYILGQVLHRATGYSTNGRWQTLHHPKWVSACTEMLADSN